MPQLRKSCTSLGLTSPGEIDMSHLPWLPVAPMALLSGHSEYLWQGHDRRAIDMAFPQEPFHLDPPQ